MKNKILFLVIVINIALCSNSAISKILSNKIYIGKATSLTGKYSSDAAIFNSQHKKNIKKINDNGGVKVGGKTYMFEIVFYDDESNISSSNNLITRLILHDGIEYIILPHNLELNDSVKDLIKKYNVTTTLSKKAIFRYKDAFETVNSFDSKKINIYLQNN